jgi:hypothetical protein
MDATLQEQESILKVGKIADNAIPLANIIELSASVIIKVAGKDVADTLQQESLNRNILSNLVANRIKEKLLAKE